MIGILAIWIACLISFLSWCELERKKWGDTVREYYTPLDVLLWSVFAPGFYVVGLGFIHEECKYSWVTRGGY